MDAILNGIKNLIEIIGGLEALVAAIVALAVAGIAAYKKIMELINTATLTKAVVPLITKAEVEPSALLRSLVHKPELTGPLTSNDNLNAIVSQALVEREPKLLKKLKLKDVIEVGGFVSSVYQSIAKPLIKGLKK